VSFGAFGEPHVRDRDHDEHRIHRDAEHHQCERPAEHLPIGERRHEADRDENELASRIQALGADRSRLADELDGSLVKSRRLERANREIAERLDAAIGTIRSVLDAGES